MGTKVEIITRTVNNYKFYCDDCGVYIGESEEFDDGYLPDPEGVYGIDIKAINIDVGQNSLHFRRECLCEACYEKEIKKIYEGLKSLGFKDDKDEE